MKTLCFKKNILLLGSFILGCIGNMNAQPIPSPQVWEELFPSTSSEPTNVYITFNFGSFSPTYYTLRNAKGCTIISNTNGGKQAVVQFSDKKEGHQFELYNSSSGGVWPYVYTKIKTLDGIKGAFSVPLPGIPYPYDDILTADIVGRCKTVTFRYTSPSIKYKDASGVDFGISPMNQYEWLVPKGWKVFGTPSDGVTPIPSTNFADITPDPLSTGEFKIRAKNNYGINLARSTWFSLFVDRPATILKVISDKPSINCGDQNPVNFSIENASLISCVNSYTWNIGAGWLLSNGTVPNTPYSTGAVNNLQLIPDCGKALGSVSATITVGGVNYNSSNSVSIPINQPSFSISGLTSLCTGNTSYTINPTVPCNSTIAWIAPPTNVATLSSLSASPTILTYGGTSSSFNLTANVTTCGVTAPVILPIHVGPYLASDYAISWNGGTPPYFCLNQNITFTLAGAAGTNGATASNYNWTYLTGWTMQYNGSSFVTLKTSASNYPPTGDVSVLFNDGCGALKTNNFFVAYSSAQCGSAGSPYSITPNPAASSITIACISLQTYCNIAQVQITDLNGVVKSSQSWPYTNQQVQINLPYLTNGTYIAKIYSGTQWYSNTFVIQH